MNKIIPAFILLVLLSILGGFLYMYRDSFTENAQWKIKKHDPVPVTYEEQNNQAKHQAEQDAENYNNAIKEKRLDFCNAIQESKKKEECHDMIGASEALAQKNPELCTVLNSRTIKERCQDNIAYFLAIEAGDATSCKSIRDETIQTQCRQSIDEAKIDARIASGSLDMNLCESISDATLADDCKRKVTTEKDSTLYRGAIADSSLTTCDSISDRVTQGKCRNAVLFDLAVKEGNLDYCTSITDKERSEYCRKALLGRQDVSRYQQIVRTGNLESCDELSVIQMKNQCHDTIIFAKVRESNDTGMCEFLFNTGITTQCRELISSK